jgi:hypothetical protein
MTSFEHELVNDETADLMYDEDKSPKFALTDKNNEEIKEIN